MRLGIDYGTATTRAVLVWPDGRWTPLLFDGSPLLPSGVYVDPERGLLTGGEAWQHAADRPDGYLAGPKTLLAQDTVSLGGRDVEVTDLVAATLRRVGAEAARVAGQPVEDVTLTIPAWWGPARRTVLRRAATRAGLPQPRLVESPIALAAHLLGGGAAIPVGSAVVVCDFGAGGLEVAVVRRAADRLDVLSVIQAPDGAGAALDTAVADHLTALTAQLPRTDTPPTSPTMSTAPDRQDPTVRTDGRLRLLAQVRAARQSLVHTPAVAVPTDGPPVILDQPTLHTLARPVLARAVDTIRAALQAAEVTVEQIAGVYYLGGTAALPWLATTLTEGLGVTPIPVADADLAAVRGALNIAGSPAAPPEPATPAGRRRIRHYAAVAAPAAGSAILLVHATATAQPVPVPGTFDRNLFVLADWGEYALAALLIFQAAIGVGVLAAVHLHRALQRADPGSADSVGKLLGRFLPAAAATGIALAGLYGVIGAVWHRVPNGPFLRWTIYPTLPATIAVAATALLALRRPRIPAGSWLDWLTFPATSTGLAAAGMYLVRLGRINTDPTTRSLTIPAAYLGAALLGTGAALAIPARLPYQALATPPLVLLAVVLTVADATGTLAGVYALAVAAWWLTRAAQLATAFRTGPHGRSVGAADSTGTRPS